MTSLSEPRGCLRSPIPSTFHWSRRLGRQGPAAQDEITRLLREITRLFHEIKQVTDRLLALAQDAVNTEKQAAVASARFWSNVNIIVSLLAVAFLVLTKWAVARSIVRAPTR